MAKAKKAPKKQSAAPKKKDAGTSARESINTTKRVEHLMSELQRGLPTRREMRYTGPGVLRKEREWQRRARPILAELERLTGRRIRIEPLRDED